MEVGIRELRDGLSRWVDAVREGATITVTDRGRAVALLVPMPGPRHLEQLIAEGVVRPGVPGSQRPEPAPALANGTASDLVAERRR